MKGGSGENKTRMDEEQKLQAENPSPGGRKICVAFDGSKFSSYVLEWCAEKAFHSNDQITFVHTVEYSNIAYLPGAEMGGIAAGMVLNDLNEEVKKNAIKRGTQFLQRTARQATSLGFKPAKLKLLLAHPATSVKRAIYEFVEDTKPNLLICGSRGMGAMGRAFIGSVSDYLMHNVSCTIMIVKAPAEEQTESKEHMNTE
eukprot:CAMPEP_0197522270 /NCGR_PEP_ID=MMETSP1318-20131121/7450_1 /TAXON_ID=552666 /ORGANISM="Partenskyella glossopodia, Strain RCC365" /LENGTH=199 /DNA_ID=CAMNT_0043074595 /DNA_START=27 /DNA_END=626 /DNA_ORIENTATION=+